MSSSKEIAHTILSQLGGNKFLVMTGSKNLSYGEDEHNRCFLSMKLSGLVNKRKYSHLKIVYNFDDTYTMVFQKVKQRTEKQLMKALALGNELPDAISITETIFEEVYCDQLAEIFERETGLYTHL